MAERIPRLKAPSRIDPGAVRVLACALLVASVPAAAAIESRGVLFPKGTSAASLDGPLQGDKTIDDRHRARAGPTRRHTPP
jgi:hypothetical protein